MKLLGGTRRLDETAHPVGHQVGPLHREEVTRVCNDLDPCPREPVYLSAGEVGG